MRTSRFQSAVAFAGALRGSIAVLDALGVAGEEEELAQTQSTSVGRVAAMAGVMLLWSRRVSLVVLEVSAQAFVRMSPSFSENADRAST